LVENVIWGRGLAENVIIPLYGRMGSKIAQKTSSVPLAIQAYGVKR